MVRYQMLPYRPRLAQVVAPVATDVPIVTAPAAAPVPEGLFWTALAGAAAYASIRTGMRETGFARVAGWAGGIAAGLAALTGLTGLLAPSAARTFPLRWYFA